MKLMITPDEIRYFKTISATGNMTRASERLGVTQPTLSHAMKRLEAELGCALLIRNKTGARLTKAGEKLSSLIEDLELSWSRVHSLVSDEVNLVEGSYSIGCHPAVGLSTIHRFMGPLLRDYPKLAIHLRHGLSREITEALLANRLDLGIIANPSRHPDLVLTELCTEKFALWKSSDLMNSDVLICDPDLAQVQKLIEACNKKGIRFKRQIHSSSLELTAKLTSEGVGVGILPERVLMELSHHKCKLVPNAPVIKDRVCVVHRKGNQTTEAASVILNAIKSVKY